MLVTDCSDLAAFSADCVAGPDMVDGKVCVCVGGGGGGRGGKGRPEETGVEF